MSGENGRDMFLTVVLTNLDKMPVTITSLTAKGYKWWWPWKVEEFFIISKRFPVRLEGKSEHTEYLAYPDSELKKFLDKNLQEIYAIDSTKEQYKVPAKDMRKLKNDMQEYLKQNQR